MRKHGRKLLGLLVILSMVVTMQLNVAAVGAAEISNENQNSAEANGFAIDNTGTLIGYTGPGGDVIVPSEVTAVASNVFAGNTTLTSVTLPASVAILGTGVFANCTSLTTVTIQGNVSAIPVQTFYNCENLKSVYVPASVTSIASEAFAECISLSGITIPAAVASIGERAFYDCISLSGVSIPDAVSSIGTGAFEGCANMTSYSVASGNGQYASSGGCLYNKTMTKLLSCPEGRSSVTIANGTKIIGSRAFYNCSAMHSLTIPSTVTTIETDAFAESGINDITIYSGVTNIGSQSSWTADIIYGESDSAAENYANDNSIVFQALNTNPSTETETETETEKPNNNNNKPGNDTNKPGDNNSGSSTNQGTTGTSNGDNNNSGNGATKTAYSSGKTEAAATAHQKDETPKTGDGINPIIFFCIAFFLTGICLFVVGRRKELSEK